MQDRWNTKINYNDNEYTEGVYTGMYFYLIDEQSKDNLDIMGNCNAIHSLWFSPILERQDLELLDVDYDVDRFGKMAGMSIDSNPKLDRILAVNNCVKQLGSFPCYERIRTNNKYRNWQNESRLYNYPYSYAMVCDYINQPFELQYHLIPTHNIDIYAKAFISDKGMYSLYVKNYKGDSNGNIEGAINSAPLDMPVSSSAYSQYSSSQKASAMFNMQTQMDNARAGAFQSVANGLMGINPLNPLSVFGGGMNIGMTAYRTQMQIEQAIGQKSAMEKDLQNTPRSMINSSSDIGFSLLNSNNTMQLVRMSITDEYMERLGDYFALYGYKQSKMMVVNYRDRHYYNYIKTVGANITPKAWTGIPKEHLRELKEIFNNGVTVWHMDREGVEFLNYNYDNYEVD